MNKYSKGYFAANDDIFIGFKSTLCMLQAYFKEEGKDWDCILHRLEDVV